MKHNDPTLNTLRADILADTKRFLQCLESGASAEELSAILTQIKDKETLLINKEGSMMAPDLWKLLYNRLVSKINRASPDNIDAVMSGRKEVNDD